MRIEECTVSTALDVIGGKWKPLILWALKQGPHRFSELRRKVPGAPAAVHDVATAAAGLAAQLLAHVPEELRHVRPSSRTDHNA